MNAIFRAHGITSRSSIARKRALAEKLGVNYISRADQLRNEVAELREKGLNWQEIAREMGASERTARRYDQKLNEVEVPVANRPLQPQRGEMM